MKNVKKSILVLLVVLVFAAVFYVNAFAGTNPSANVQNGDIWRYGNTPEVSQVDTGFDTALGAGDVRLSQQVIADHGDGLFDVELKVQGGSSVKVVPEEAVVFLLDESGSVGTANWQYMRNACVSMMDSFNSEINAYFGIVKFGTNAVQSLALTNNRATVKNSLGSLSYAGGNTNLLAGLNLALQLLNTYTGKGPKHIVLITDGYPNTGGTEAQCLQRIKELKDSGIYIYAAGFGSGVNLNFINQLASNAESSVYVSNASQLTNLLALPDTGYGAAIAKNAQRNVAINMGSEIDYVNILSNDGGGASVTATNGTLYWNPNPNSQDLIDVRTLVYQIQMKPGALDQGFKPVSSSAILNYTDADERTRVEKFDIPNVRMTSFVTVTFVDHDGTVLDAQTIPKSSPATAPDEPDNKYGWHFVDWDKDFSCVTEDMTVTALYEINIYDVTFLDWDGSVLGEEEVEHGSATTAPAEPERVGYTFIGWDTDFSCVTDDLTVTALYEINIYTVSFYKQSQDGNNKIAKTPFATQQVTYNELIDFTKISVGKNAVWYYTDGTTYGAKFDVNTPITGELKLAVKDQNNNQQ